MKNLLLVVMVFVVAAAMWLAVPYWAADLSAFVLHKTGKCPAADIEKCKDILSALGATGDIFGAVTSLFSGLALLGVAVTLWADVKSRREARKPLVVACLNQGAVVLEAPEFGTLSEESKLTISITLTVSNSMPEAALNTVVRSVIEIDGRPEQVVLPDATLKLPITSATPEEVETSLCIGWAQLEPLLTALTNSASQVRYLLATSYTNLEGVKWQTSAKFHLVCRRSDMPKLNSLRSHSDDFLEHWKNSATVELESAVEPESWIHKRV